MKPIVITVCVGYWDFLNTTLPSTLAVSKHVYIVTDEARTIDDPCVTVLVSDCFDKTLFNKAGAVRHAQKVVHSEHPGDWVLLLDADIVIPGDFRFPSSLHPWTLYGVNRIDYQTPDDYASGTGTHYASPGAGYFQLYFDKTKMYPEESEDASGCDMDFFWSFSRRELIRGVSVQHLGYHTENWKGRVTERWE